MMEVSNVVVASLLVTGEPDVSVFNESMYLCINFCKMYPFMNFRNSLT